jgi:hypothetical protein
MPTKLILAVAERSPFAGGAAFGDAGAYERIIARARFAVDPEAPAQRTVVDLENAPRDTDGLVEFSADVFLLHPATLARGNRRLLVEFANRGNKRALQFFNDARHSNAPLAPGDAGNGFLMRRGYTVGWVAWQADVLPGDGRLTLDVPVAMDHSRPITAPVRAEFVVEERVFSLPLSGRASTRSYPAATLDRAASTLTRRQYAADPRIPIPQSEWAFARVEGGEGEVAIVPSDRHVYLQDGFRPGWIYELVYPGTAPRVMGLGFVAVRDLVSFLKHDERDAGGAQNPLRDGGIGIEKAYCWGRSQGGRVIREFIYSGFNADPKGRRVFDGAFPHVSGGGRMWLNHRFSQPNRLSGSQHQDSSYYGDRFPFSYASSTDHLTGATDAILKRPDTDPLVIHTQTSTEYWSRRGSLVHTDTRGADLPQPETVRIYLWASSQHMSDPWMLTPARGANAQQPANVVGTSPLFRALLDHLDRWATDGRLPPASRVPTRAVGQLVDSAEWRRRFPRIPGVALPREPARLPLWDYGPDEAHGLLTLEPPAADPDREYTILVPAVDADGNETAGIRMPLVQAPLATHTGWNVRASGFSPGVLVGLPGSYLPFPKTRSEREATGDPRRSVEERFPTDEEFVRAIERAAGGLVEDGFLLEEDRERIEAAARRWGRAGTVFPLVEPGARTPRGDPRE